MDKLPVSIVVPCYNEYSLTLECLGRIHEATPEVESIIVVDDGSYVFETEYLCDTLIRHSQNKGAAPSFNDGIALSRSKYVALFNNDTMVANGWLEPLVEFMEENQTIPITGSHLPARIGMVSPRVFGPEEDVAEGIHINYPYRSSYEDWVKNYSTLAVPDGKLEVMPFDKGGPWLFRMDMFHQIGLFDEQFVPANWEETDLFVRMALHGWIFCSLNSSYSYHFCHGTINKHFKEEGGVLGLYHINKERFEKKWGTTNIDLMKVFMTRSINGL